MILIRFFIVGIVCLLSYQVEAKKIVEYYEPANWWVGMNYNRIQIAIKGDDISESFFKVNYEGISFEGVVFTKDPDIVFIKLNISPKVNAGKIPINIYQKGRLKDVIYIELLNRQERTYDWQPFNNEEIYQVVIDRFSRNKNKGVGKDPIYPGDLNMSYGGDINGVIEKIPYLKNLGVSTIELSPLYESKVSSFSYYKNQVTNHYKIDSGLGTVSDFEELLYEAHENNMQVNITQLYHMVGQNHWLLNNAVIDHCIIFQENKMRSLAFLDPHSSTFHQKDAEVRPIEGSMCVNQKIEVVRRYLIQNAVWSLEKYHPDGLKIEQIECNDFSFVQELLNTIKQDFPDMNVILDMKSTQSDQLAFLLQQFSEDLNIFGYDYAMYYTVQKAFFDYYGQQEGVEFLYKTTANDFVYDDLNRNIAFLGNAFTSRAYTSAESSLEKLKMMLIYSVFVRSNFSSLFGDEWLLEGNINRGQGVANGIFAIDFEEGKNEVNKRAITHEEKTYYDFFKSVLLWKRNNEELLKSKLIHFLPKDGVYVLLRFTTTECVMLVVNNNSDMKKLNADYFLDQIVDEYKYAVNPLTQKQYDDLKHIILDPKSCTLMKIVKE